jgi:hypothetical protein
MSEPVEMDHSVEARSESFSLDQYTADVCLKLDTLAHAYTLSDAMIGQLFEWPYLPGSGLYAKNTKVEPFVGKTASDGGAGLVYPSTLLHVHFETLPGGQPGSIGGTGHTHGDEPTALYSVSVEAANENISVPVSRVAQTFVSGGDPDPDYPDLAGTGHYKPDASKPPIALFRWSSMGGDALDDSEAPGKLLHVTDLVIRWTRLQQIPDLDGENIIDYADHVNDAGISTPFGDCAAETLLLASPKIQMNVTTAGTTFDMELRYRYRPLGWNSFWRSKTSSWEEIVYAFDAGGHSAGDAVKVFPLKDFSPLLPDGYA